MKGFEFENPTFSRLAKLLFRHGPRFTLRSSCVAQQIFNIHQHIAAGLACAARLAALVASGKGFKHG